MASRSYRARVIVLRKTKLREKDLIVTMLDESGALRQAVAKGARRPGGSFAARLELFSTVDGWFAEGKSLDVITDAKLVDEGVALPFGVEQAACASALAELVCSVAQEGLSHDRLFDMTRKALGMVRTADGETALALACAGLLKTFGMAGFRPSFDACVSCGSQIDWPSKSDFVRISIPDGGAVCPNCRSVVDAVSMESHVVGWARALMLQTFEHVAEAHPDVSTMFGILQFADQWTRVHVGKNLKSIDYLFTSGLY